MKSVSFFPHLELGAEYESSSVLFLRVRVLPAIWSYSSLVGWFSDRITLISERIFFISILRSGGLSLVRQPFPTSRIKAPFPRRGHGFFFLTTRECSLLAVQIHLASPLPTLWRCPFFLQAMVSNRSLTFRRNFPVCSLSS